MMNPMNYLGSPSATNAKYYRIRYGTADSNTSVAIPLIVGTRAQNLGYSVDMATPFGWITLAITIYKIYSTGWILL